MLGVGVGVDEPPAIVTGATCVKSLPTITVIVEPAAGSATR
jgi:hypothetical protein